MENDLKIIEKEFRCKFPNYEIDSIEKYNNGFNSKAYHIKLINSPKEFAVKIFTQDNHSNIQKNIQIVDYIAQKGIPTIKVYPGKSIGNSNVLFMGAASGRVVSEFFQDVSEKIKSNILVDAGKVLSNIHKLEIPEIWIQNKHAITSVGEWIDWTHSRVKKYLDFFEGKLTREQLIYLTKQFLEFRNLSDTNFGLVPLHWDYHFSNMNATEDGTITAVFDFENAMKGHNLADIGQTLYWYVEQTKGISGFNSFLEGYNASLTQQDKKLIWAYFLLFLLAVMRTNWKKKHLCWLIEENTKFLNEIITNRITL